MRIRNWTGSVCLGFVLAAACGGDNGGGSTGNFFFESAANTAPVFEPNAVEGLLRLGIPIRSAKWDFGGVNYELFNLLREYVNERDEGTIGLDNIYKLLYQAGSFYGEAASGCNAITATSISSPFDFGVSETYDCAINETTFRHGSAIREGADGTKNALLAWQVLNNDGHDSDEKGVLQGSSNPTTGDLSLHLATYVNYTAKNDFSLRTEIAGNDQTHHFTLRTMKYTQDGYWITTTGSGISQGAGQFFLFKVSDQSGISGRYYCFPADANEETLQAADDAGSATVPADCAVYEEVVNALVPFQSSDLPTSDANFNTGNAKEGTIYLNGID
jgi:hypothetical protein